MELSELGAIAASRHRATREPNPQAVSAVPASVDYRDIMMEKYNGD